MVATCQRFPKGARYLLVSAPKNVSMMQTSMVNVMMTIKILRALVTTLINEVALGVVAQIGRHRHPQVAPAPSQPVLENDASELAPLAKADAVAQEESRALGPTGIGGCKRRLDNVQRFLAAARPGTFAGICSCSRSSD